MEKNQLDFIPPPWISFIYPFVYSLSAYLVSAPCAPGIGHSGGSKADKFRTTRVVKLLNWSFSPRGFPKIVWCLKTYCANKDSEGQ